MSAATLDAEPNVQSSQDTSVPAEAAPGCPKCGNLDSWGHCSWCPNCGYYPRLGTSVGVADWKETDRAAGDGATLVERLSRVPSWAQWMAAGMLAVFVGNLLASLVLPARGPLRAWASLLELVVGAALFLGAHSRAFVAALLKDARFAPLDFLMRPGEIWRHTFMQLPESAKRVWLAAWALTSIVCAMGVIGGLRYSALVDDWGFRQRATPKLAQKVTVAMQKAEEKSMEEALRDGAANVDVNDHKGDEKESKLKMLTAECVIIGYTQRPNEKQFAELIVASVVGEQLRYVGMVSTGIPEDVREEINSRLKQLPAVQPVVPCSITGKWVQPKLTCSVAFKSWSSDGYFQQPTFDKILAEVQSQ
jgi:hypothetical protein